ncbi:MAG TPA: type II secretion system protein N [Casimicrobiaceae bacterium]|nr:type II secretion system protein N [Casimicrobiaceae bacterium]
MRSLVVVLLGAVIFAAATTFFAPASLLDQRVARASDGRVRIANASGTLWHGRGVVVAARGQVRLPIEWQLDKVALVRGIVDIALLQDRTTNAPRAHLRVNGERVEVRDIDVTIPAAALGERVSGKVNIASDAIAIARGRASGALSIEWRHAKFEPNPQQVIDLGDVDVRLKDSGSGMAGPLEARGGPILAHGTVTLTATTVVIDAELVPARSADDHARQALAMLGKLDVRGAVRVSLSRDLR